MKIEVNEAAAPQAPEYPCVMRQRTDPELVVMFVGPAKGFVVAAGPNLGEHVGRYMEVGNTSAFTPFHGTITITCP
ncbi:MAG: hypothetical protein WC718_00020 [Phycisphaerales bacterium]|jgi:hypothetical protein